MVFLNKSLTLESRDGAGATLIDATGLGVGVVGVDAGASGATVGKNNQGFTLLGGFTGLTTDNPGPSDLKVGGNIAVNNVGDGFLFHGGTAHLVTGNLALSNGVAGFKSHLGNGSVFKDNVAVANRLDHGFSINGGNGHSLTGNLAIGNGGGGFGAQGTGHVFTRNSALGNRLFGMGFIDGATVTVDKNNLYGNDLVTNCGLFSAAGSSVDATNNFWGAETGPGPNPADNVCVGAGSATVIPFAAEDFEVATVWK